jgi:predicted nicotinamide N-methyase
VIQSDLCQRILADTAFEPAGDLVPEIRLHLATTPREILRESGACAVNRTQPPYWAFAWPGGQALARYILDHPELVHGRLVMDVGSGSAIASIAAMKAGAAKAIANDIDPLACAAAELNARDNQVEILVSATDILDSTAELALLIIGDLVYEPRLEDSVRNFLMRSNSAGTPVLFGDRATARLPSLPFCQVGEYETVVAPPLEDGYVEIARVWQLEPQ